MKNRKRETKGRRREVVREIERGEKEREREGWGERLTETKTV